MKLFSLKSFSQLLFRIFAFNHRNSKPVMKACSKQVTRIDLHDRNRTIDTKCQQYNVFYDITAVSCGQKIIMSLVSTQTPYFRRYCDLTSTISTSHILSIKAGIVTLNILTKNKKNCQVKPTEIQYHKIEKTASLTLALHQKQCTHIRIVLICHLIITEATHLRRKNTLVQYYVPSKVIPN